MQYGTQEPGWDRLTAMINELAAKKGLVRLRTPSIVEAEEGHAPQRPKDVSYRRLGRALKKSPTIIYGICGSPEETGLLKAFLCVERGWTTKKGLWYCVRCATA